MFKDKKLGTEIPCAAGTGSGGGAQLAADGKRKFRRS